MLVPTKLLAVEQAKKKRGLELDDNTTRRRSTASIENNRTAPATQKTAKRLEKELAANSSYTPKSSTRTMADKEKEIYASVTNRFYSAAHASNVGVLEVSQKQGHLIHDHVERPKKRVGTNVTCVFHCHFVQIVGQPRMIQETYYIPSFV
jgi:hypothetical protein